MNLRTEEAAGTPAQFGGARRWAIYDLGHSAFSMIVLAVLFPILFNGFWAESLPPYKKTAAFNLTLACASIAVALLSPLLATIAQRSGLRMKFFRVLAAAGIAGMAALALCGAGNWHMASAVYVVAAIGFFGANLFYDSLLISVAPPQKRHVVSGLAFSLGYAGGVLLLASIFVWTQPVGYEFLGFAERPDPAWLFVGGAVWWLVFALPLLCRNEPQNTAVPAEISEKSAAGTRFTGTLRDLRETCVAFWKTKTVRWFILAYFCYIDGVHTVITGAVRYGDQLGFAQSDLFLALFIVQIFGVPCALLFGVFGKIFGPRPTIFTALAIYCCVVFYGAIMPIEPFAFGGVSVSPMFILAALIGMVQGGVQALSRSYFTTLIPAGREVAFFGFYCMIGRCSTILGPLLLSAVAVIFSGVGGPNFSTRAGIASISLLFAAGIVFLSFVGKNAAEKSVPAKAKAS